MEVKLVYNDKELGKAWEKHFLNHSNVELIEGDITQIPCDATVSPANSFGFMDGGLDYALSERFGWHLQDILQEQIHNTDEGELLIGTSMTLKTGDEKIPFLIVAPTMRVPMSFNIDTSVNAYLAMKAILIACKNNDQIQTVSIPGLCTGCGRMPSDIAATQMYLAYEEVVLNKKRKFEGFSDAQKFQNKLNKKGLIWDY
jgi:O-acetyl-ADP-ribose deacetylase (regulator of RNase III)